jgi:hypothetical protein
MGTSPGSRTSSLVCLGVWSFRNLGQFRLLRLLSALRRG